MPPHLFYACVLVCAYERGKGERVCVWGGQTEYVCAGTQQAAVVSLSPAVPLILCPAPHPAATAHVVCGAVVAGGGGCGGWLGA